MLESGGLSGANLCAKVLAAALRASCLLVVIVASCVHAQPWTNTALAPEARADLLLAQMSLDEKILDSWLWVSTNPAPFCGALANQSAVVAGLHQHYFYDATAIFAVSNNDNLIAYVYLDPANVPSEIMLQWNDGTWEHRAYWGVNQILYGTTGTNSRRYMGVLPPAGQWVRLTVSASQVGLQGEHPQRTGVHLCRRARDVGSRRHGSITASERGSTSRSNMNASITP